MGKRKRKSLEYTSKTQKTPTGMIYEDSKGLLDLNSPLLLLHNSYGGLMKVSIYS